MHNHLIKIDNETSKPTDFQQLCQRSVGLLVPKLCHRCYDGNIRCIETVAPSANHHDCGSCEYEEAHDEEEPEEPLGIAPSLTCKIILT